MEIQSALLRATETFLGPQHSLAQGCSEEEAGLGTRGSGGRAASGGRRAGGEEGNCEGAQSCAFVSAGDLCRFRAARAMVRDRAGVRPIQRARGCCIVNERPAPAVTKSGGGRRGGARPGPRAGGGRRRGTGVAPGTRVGACGCEGLSAGASSRARARLSFHCGRRGSKHSFLH